MDNLNSINNYKELDAWVDVQLNKYNRIKTKTQLLKDQICPNDTLHNSLIGIEDYRNLTLCFSETIRNCQIILRKIDIYDEVSVKENNFQNAKKICKEIYKLNSIYVKKWNEIAPIVKSAIRTIKESKEDN